MYQTVTTGPVSEAKLKRALKTGKLALTAGELSGSGFITRFHPMNAAAISKAKKLNKGVNLKIAKGEILSNFEENQGSSLGGSIWSNLWSGIKKMWPSVKPLVSQALDAAVVPLTSAVASSPLSALAPAVAPARALLKQTTGVGIKGSQAAKDRMKAVRAAKKSKSGNKVNVLAGSFLIN